MSKQVAAILFLALHRTLVHSLTIEEDGVESAVTVLNDANFEELVNAGKDVPWFVKFYAPWCGHCKSLAPEWERLPSLLNGNVRVGKVDGTEEKRLAAEFEIQGFPDLRLIASGKMYNYEGERNAEAMAEWAGGEYINGKADRLAADQTQLDKLLKGLRQVLQSITAVTQHMPALLPLTLAVGFWIGFVFLYLVGFLVRPVVPTTTSKVQVTVKIDGKTGSGLSIDPLTMKIIKVAPERKDLSEINVGDTIVAVNKKLVYDSDDYREITHTAGKTNGEFTLTVGRHLNGNNGKKNN